MKTQYIVQESDKSKRKDFYDYIVNNYDLKISYPYSKVRFVNDNFPFVVDFKEKRFWICSSITCCAAAASNHAIITIDDFKKLVRRR